MAFGFNFRQTKAYTTDPANTECISTTPKTLYPTTLTINSVGYSVGYVGGLSNPPYYSQALIEANSRNRSLAVDARLAGTFQCGNDKKTQIKIILPSVGDYDISLASGDASNATTQSVRIYDTSTLLASIGSATSVSSGRFMDANAVVHTSSANWVANNTVRRLSFSTTEARIEFGAGDGISSGTNSTINHINFSYVGASASVDSINGGTNSVQIGSTGNTVATTGLTTATSASLNGVAMTSVAGSSSPWTFSCPPLTDGAVSPYPSGTFSITGAEGSPTLAGVAVTLPTGLTAQTLAGTLNTTNTGVLHDFSPAAVVTDRIFYPPVPTVGKYITVDAQGNIDTDYAGTTEFWHWQASTGITRSYDVITGNGAVIGVTSSGQTSRSLTASGLTHRGL